MDDPAPLLEMRGITKHFGDVCANDGIDLVLFPGDILGLLGENGAGKTTLVNILFGAYSADRGSIVIDGRPVHIRNSADALALGVGMVHQHFHLAPRLSVLENLIVGQPGRRGRLDIQRASARMCEIEHHYKLCLDPHRLISTLSVGEQQRLEIMKALFRGARILILDEPTAVLTPGEVEGLFAALRAMSVAGIGVILVSHKLNEVRSVANRAVILRHGRVTGRIDKLAGVTESELAHMMCGVEIVSPKKIPAQPGPTLLSVERVSTNGHTGMSLRDVSFSVQGGEILGIAGVSGNGQRALADVLAGTLRPRTGKVTVAGKLVEVFTPLAMQALGLGRIPEDRMTTGLVTTLPLADNMVLSRIDAMPFSRHGLLNQREILGFAERQIQAFDIRCPGPKTTAGRLSGGNLQKLLLARELAFNPIVLLAAQPTRGLDIGATRFVHEQFLAMRAQGRAIALISEDLEELMALADRIAVMYEGRIAGVMDINQVRIDWIGLLMSGVGVQ